MALGWFFKTLYFNLFLTVLLLVFSGRSISAQEKNNLNVSTDMQPVAAELVVNATLFPQRRRLGNFQICALCTCCGGPHGLCLPSPCCYAINCNIPNRPFGYCSFTPKTCNCFGCHL